MFSTVEDLTLFATELRWPEQRDRFRVKLIELLELFVIVNDVPGIIETARDVFDIPVKTDGDTVVTLEQVATIRRTFKDRANFARVNGIPAISIEVSTASCTKSIAPRR